MTGVGLERPSRLGDWVLCLLRDEVTETSDHNKTHQLRGVSGLCLGQGHGGEGRDDKVTGAGSSNRPSESGPNSCPARDPCALSRQVLLTQPQPWKLPPPGECGLSSTVAPYPPTHEGPKASPGATRHGLDPCLCVATVSGRKAAPRFGSFRPCCPGPRLLLAQRLPRCRGWGGGRGEASDSLQTCRRHAWVVVWHVVGGQHTLVFFPSLNARLGFIYLIT